MALAGVDAGQGPPTSQAPRRDEPGTFSPRRGLKGRIPVATPTPEQEAELDRLFPPDWYKEASVA